MLSLALGEVGLLPDTFWDLTWPEFDYAVQAYETRNARQMEGHRLLYTLVYNGFFAPEGKRYTPAQLIPLSIDPYEAPTTAVPQESPEAFMARMGFKAQRVEDLLKKSPTAA